MDSLYPNHTKVLINAKLAPETFPTMYEVLKEVNSIKKKKKRIEKAENSSTQDKSTSAVGSAMYSWVKTRFV